jgi:hypothetical protein
VRFDALPQLMPGMRSWGARCGPFDFIIAYEDGEFLRPEDRADCVGYSASYRDRTAENQITTQINGAQRWQTFKEAERACRATWQKLRRKVN